MCIYYMRRTHRLSQARWRTRPDKSTAAIRYARSACLQPQRHAHTVNSPGQRSSVRAQLLIALICIQFSSLLRRHTSPKYRAGIIMFLASGAKSALTVAALAAAFIGLVSANSCVQCNSRDDSRCAEFPQHLGTSACANTTALGCYTRIVDGGHTVRGCISSLPADECATAPICNSCINVNNLGGCNSQLFPELRLSCHQCNGTLNSTCASAPTELAALCNVFDVSNQCYIRRTNETITRGCTSSDNGGCTERQHCFICDGFGCNLLEHTDPQIPLAPSAANVPLMSVLLVMLSTALLALMAQ